METSKSVSLGKRRVVKWVVIILVAVFVLRSACLAASVVVAGITQPEQYSARADSIKLNPDVYYGHDTVGGLRHATRVRNQTLAFLGATNLRTTITFSRYMDYEEVKAYLDEHGLTAENLYACTPSLTSIMLRMNDFGDEDVARYSENLADPSFAGWSAVDVLADSWQLKELEADEDTFLVDTNNDLFRWWNTVPIGGLRNGFTQKFWPSLSWKLAEAGLL